MKNRKTSKNLRLKALRAGLDMTQQVLATKAGMSIVTYNEIELGRREPTADDLLALARVLKCQPSDIRPAADAVTR